MNVRFDYTRAFSRNRGLVSSDEQQVLRDATVAIAGAGGVGGWHAIALARQGISGFRLADPDTFDLVNFNRQVGAMVSTIGRKKTDVLGEMLREINPEVRVEAWSKPLDASNVNEFLEGTDVAIDGLDVLAIPARRHLLRAARARSIWALGAGPLGFGAAFLAFAPTGMEADAYFGFEAGMSSLETLAAFLVGFAPSGLHLPYLDLREVDLPSGAAPSSGAACMFCGALVATETIALLTGKRKPRAAPRYAQWDLMRGKLAQGIILGGAKNPLQRLRRRVLTSRLVSLGIRPPSVDLAAGVP